MRKKTAARRRILPDPKFNDLLVAKFINSVLKNGKKHLASGIFYDAFEIIDQRIKGRGDDLFRKA
jgi:small subunit ribosomal protein S7